MAKFVLYFLLSVAALLAFSGISEARSPQINQTKNDKQNAAVEKTQAIINEIVQKSYPELKIKKIKIKTFESDSNYFKVRFSYMRYFLFLKMRYLIYVNPKVFELNAPEEGIRAILAHELAHVLYYTEKNRLELIGLGSLACGSFTSKFERKTDLEAIARSYGEGLIQYRKWLYQNVPAKKLDNKKRDYFSPEEIDLLIPAIKENPGLIEKLRKDVPRNIEETKQVLK